MDEGDRAFGTRARRRIDQLGTGRGQARELGGEVRGAEAHVVQTLAPRGEEAGDAALLVHRLDQLQAGRGRRTGGQEAELDPLGGDDPRRLGGASPNSAA